jgi:mono/diheme cytochrome c family protein
MKTPAVILAVVVVGIIATVGFAYSGIYDVSASSSHSGLVNWLLSTTSHASMERRAKDIEVPDLDDDALVLAGVNDFDSMCTGCHGAPGRDPEAMGKGLNPSAPDLAEEAAELSPAELFWVTKNGIKMTGMPAWGATHGDDSIWPVVAFMTKLPGLDETAYQQLLASAVGQGHHAADADAAEHSHEEAAPSSGDGDHEHPDSAPAEEHSHDEAAGEGAAHEHPESSEHEAPMEIETSVGAPEEHDHSTHEH